MVPFLYVHVFYFSRHTNCQRIFRQIVYNYTPCSNCCPFANRYPRYSFSAYPAKNSLS